MHTRDAVVFSLGASVSAAALLLWLSARRKPAAASEPDRGERQQVVPVRAPAPAPAALPTSSNRHSLKDQDSDSDDNEDDAHASDRSALISPVPLSQLTTVIVFGADGNLASLKLLPTLWKLWRLWLLPRDLIVAGYARPKGAGGTLRSTSDFRKHVVACVRKDERKRALADRRGGENGGEAWRLNDETEEALSQFASLCHFECGQFGEEEGHRRLVGLLEREEKRRLAARESGEEWVRSMRRQASEPPELPSAAGATVRLYYLAVPPFIYPAVCSAIYDLQRERAAHTTGLTRRRGNFGGAHARADAIEERVILEKPFGRDTASCVQLMSELSMLPPEQMYFIDHYLGKELVMNMLVLRFANVCFGAVWNRQHIKSVQVIFKEDFGTEGRGGYFDQYGIIRDVMQNHLLQMLALVAMEQPLSLTAEHIRAEKLKVLQSIRPLDIDDVVVGQYDGYTDELEPDRRSSATETFCAGVLHVHSPRWDGVPFVLKAGKALNECKVELRVQFHSVPGVVSALSECSANELVVRVQPQEDIYWKVRPANRAQPRPSAPARARPTRPLRLCAAQTYRPARRVLPRLAGAEQGPRPQLRRRADADGPSVRRPLRVRPHARGVREAAARGVRGRPLALRLRRRARGLVAHLHAAARAA